MLLLILSYPRFLNAKWKRDLSATATRVKFTHLDELHLAGRTAYTRYTHNTMNRLYIMATTMRRGRLLSTHQTVSYSATTNYRTKRCIVDIIKARLQLYSWLLALDVGTLWHFPVISAMRRFDTQQWCIIMIIIIITDLYSAFRVRIQRRLMQQDYVSLNRWVFRWRLKVKMFSHSRMSAGREFQVDMEQQHQKRDGRYVSNSSSSSPPG